MTRRWPLLGLKTSPCFVTTERLSATPQWSNLVKEISRLVMQQEDGKIEIIPIRCSVSCSPFGLFPLSRSWWTRENTVQRQWGPSTEWRRHVTRHQQVLMFWLSCLVSTGPQKVVTEALNGYSVMDCHISLLWFYSYFSTKKSSFWYI